MTLDGLDRDVFEGRHVVILDELCDTGTTLMRVRDAVLAEKDRLGFLSVSRATLLSKPDCFYVDGSGCLSRPVERIPEFVGFD